MCSRKERQIARSNLSKNILNFFETKNYQKFITKSTKFLCIKRVLKIRDEDKCVLRTFMSDLKSSWSKNAMLIAFCVRFNDVEERGEHGGDFEIWMEKKSS